MSSITITRVFIEALMVGICVIIDCKNSQSYEYVVPGSLYRSNAKTKMYFINYLNNLYFLINTPTISFLQRSKNVGVQF